MPFSAARTAHEWHNAGGPTPQVKTRLFLFFFFLLFVLGGFCKQRGPSVVTQPSAGQTIKGSSNSVWLVALPSGMEKVTAPGISCASITLCQDWRRLLCQNNNVDIHHEHPSPPAVSPESMCLCVCVCPRVLPPPSLYFME